MYELRRGKGLLDLAELFFMFCQPLERDPFLEKGSDLNSLHGKIGEVLTKLVGEAKERTNCCDVLWAREVPNSGNHLRVRLDTFVGDDVPGERDLLAETKLVAGDSDAGFAAAQ